MTRAVRTGLAALFLGLAVPGGALAARFDAALERKLEAARAPAGQLEETRELRSFGTRFVRFRQEVAGIPVLGAELVVTDGPGQRADLVLDATRGRVGPPPRARVSRGAAIAAARRRARVTRLRAPARAALAILPRARRSLLVWRVLLPARSPLASFEVLVDARTRSVVRVRDLLRHEDGTAVVFDPNPVTTQGSRSNLEDNFDADSAPLNALYKPVILPRLDLNSTCLIGAWVRATLPEGDVCAPARDFTGIRRSDRRFEAVMAYFHIDRAQAYIQSLGFTNIVNRQIRANVNAIEADNSFYDPNTRQLTFGTGGVDDAEDADVIVHEYGHAIQESQIPNFEGGAVGEGFGDYLAAALAANQSPSPVFNPCIGEWDRLGAGDPAPVPCLRRTDRALTVDQVGPGTACEGRIHCAGEAWSGALWTIRSVLGGAATDRVVLQSHFSLTARSGFHEAAMALLAADQALNGGANQPFLTNLLQSRGLLDADRIDNDVSGARPLSVPGEAAGLLDVTSDMHDVYRVDLVAGARVSFRLTASGGSFDLNLYRPGTTTVADAGAIVRTAGDPGPNELLAYTPPTTGTYFVDVVVGSGGGAYRLEAFAYADGDAVADGRDNCATVANPAQTDWNGNGRGDACDRSSAATIDRVRVRGRSIAVRGTLRPADLPASAYRIVVRRGNRLVREAAGARRSGNAVVLTVRVARPGRYRLQAVVRDRRYAASVSRTVVVRIR